MRIALFAGRNIKEILRDPINLFFGLGFPLILMVLLSVINASIPPEAGNTMFAIENLAPGLAMFGTAFMALFVGMVLAKDRTSSFLTRLFTSPMTAADFLLGYTAPMLLMALAQAVITLTAACLLKLPFTISILPAVLTTALVSLLFIGIGLLCGSLMNDKAVGGICGVIGGGFKTVSQILPFYHGVAAIKQTLSGDYGALPPHLAVVSAYTTAIYLIAVFVFRGKMSGDARSE